MIDNVQLTRHPSGVTILTEHMPGLRSVTAGIWVRRGSRHESATLNGICHFIEHSVFKGTRRRTARDIAVESDRLGGHLDAYTTQEMTGFAIKVADGRLPEAIDLLSDLVSQPRFDQQDLERERKVILEEIKMVEDTPDELLGELFNAAYFPNHPLGRPIEGTAHTVSTFDQQTTADFHAHAFSRSNLVIAAAGRVEHERMVEMIERAFADGGTNADASRLSAEATVTPAPAAPILIEHKKELEQAHLIVASPFPTALSQERYAASLLASVLGGGTSSRLWQKIREERGLAYSVGAGSGTFSDVGVFTIYAGTSPKQLDEVLDLSLTEVRRIVNEVVPDDELKLVKEQAISAVLLGLESSSARAGTLARQEIIHNRHISPDEMIQSIEAVTSAEIQDVARKFFTTEKLALGALGNLNGFRVDRSRLEI
ncbi:MAG TPA: pitrilysin family protein [Pyrinomonadaceae bacterium]|nr:pitrilysin family protein [Pyrinomonadaceae bacterium]